MSKSVFSAAPVDGLAKLSIGPFAGTVITREELSHSVAACVRTTVAPFTNMV